VKAGNKNIAIGLVVLVSLFFSIRALVFLHPKPGDGKLILKVRFQNIDKMTKGTKVTFAGKPVGEVLAITPVADSREESSIAGIYPYELTLALDSSLRVYNTDEISVKTAGLMGEQFIAVTPLPVTPGRHSELLENGALVYASSGLNMEETASALSNVAKKAEQTMDTLNGLIEKNQAGLNLTMQSLERASVQFEKFMNRINEVDIPGAASKTMATASKTMANAEHVTDQIKSILSQFTANGTIKNIEKTSKHLSSIAASIDQPEKTREIMASIQRCTDEFSEMLASFKGSSQGSIITPIQELIKNFENTMQKFNDIANKLADGQGTIGKFINDDEAYYRSLRVMNRTDLLLSDINNYGILFHLDRSWQRLRRNRVEEAQMLQTPAQIRTFVDEEMKTINVSFQRLDDALDRAKVSADNPESLKNPNVRREFTESYKDLVRNVKELDTKLKTVGTVLGAESNGLSSSE